MSEWWTYGLSDFLLFSPRTYYRLFELYNAAIWPGHLLAAAVGLAIPALLYAPWPARDRIAAILLAGCWLWVAWAYLLTRYATINWAAPYLAAGFALEGLLLLLFGGRPARATREPWARAGIGLYLFALLLQPLIGPLAGRPWSQVEIFALAPDPTAAATLGLLLAADRTRWELLALPLLWCAASGATLWAMDASDAWVMPAVAAFAIGVTGWKMRARRPMQAAAPARRSAGRPPA